jgi:O-antigen ligase
MMQSRSKNNWREVWVCVLLVFLLVGLLVSRAMVSFASVLMVVPFFFNPGELKAAHLVAAALLLFPILLSGFWSDDKMLWWNSVSIKLPLVTLLLGLSGVTLSARRWKQLVYIFLLIVLAGCCWSISQYSLEIQEAYLKAKTLPTPMDNDHIRFSWLVAIGVFLGLHCLPAEKNKLIKACLIAMLVLLIAYLHLLAAKTGLACLYVGCFLYFLYAVFILKKWKTGVGMAVVVFAMALACYKTMPTLRNRIQYVVYDFQNYSKGNAMPGYNDAARWLSIRAGYDIMHAHPLTGVGAGDVLNEVNKWHQANHPESLAYERFLPANEWLVYGAAAGWPGFLFFTTLIPFLIDDTFEGQYGVVILAFIAFFGQQKLTESNV